MSGRRRAFPVVPGLGAGGGGSAPFTLPHLVNFEDYTLEQFPPDWTLTQEGSVPARVIAAPDDIVLSNFGNAKVLACESHASLEDYNKCNFELPGPVDMTKGFRFVAYGKGLVNEQALSQLCGLFDREYDDLDTETGIRAASDLWGTRGGTVFGHAAAAGVEIDMGGHSSLGGWHYHSIRLEYNHANSTVETLIYQSNGALRHSSGVKAITWDNSGFGNATHLYCFGGLRKQTYYDSSYYCGFWIGALTDAWPSTTVMPTSL